MSLRFTLLCSSACWVAAGMPADVRTLGGAWRSDGVPRVLCQADPGTAPATAVLLPPGAGACWRGILEAGPYPGTAGLRVGTDATGAGGITVELAGGDSPAFALRDAAGVVLWQDPGVGWYAYTPVWLEAVVMADRVRAQMLAADGEELLAQSPWLPYATAPSATAGHLAAFCVGNTARFMLLQRAAQPLAEASPDNPSALRLPGTDSARWVVTGGGSWRWRDASRRAVQQTRSVERTTALLTAATPRDGTWRCGIRLHQGTCGGGLLIHADKDLQTGFLVWLGGAYGNGRLMLYRYPTSSLWSGSDGIWKWDTDYVIEATRQDGRTLRARLLAADGTTVLAESPSVTLPEDDRDRRGMTGFQTWRGTGEFVPETGGATAAPLTAPDSGATAEADLGDGWRAESGEWSWADNARSGLVQRLPAGVATVRGEALRGGRGTFRCRVVLNGARAVALRFQLGADGGAGFESRFGATGLALRTAAGETLWEGGAAHCTGSGEYILEGIVSTDRVRARLLDAAGRVLTESVDRYVSDANNTRTGALGLRCEDGGAEFREWRWTAE